VSKICKKNQTEPAVTFQFRQ